MDKTSWDQNISWDFKGRQTEINFRNISELNTHMVLDDSNVSAHLTSTNYLRLLLASSIGKNMKFMIVNSPICWNF